VAISGKAGNWKIQTAETENRRSENGNSNFLTTDYADSADKSGGLGIAYVSYVPYVAKSPGPGSRQSIYTINFGHVRLKRHKKSN